MMEFKSKKSPPEKLPYTTIDNISLRPGITFRPSTPTSGWPSKTALGKNDAKTETQLRLKPTPQASEASGTESQLGTLTLAIK